MPSRDSEFSESPRGKKLARAYPPLSTIRQQERDKLYKPIAARPRPARPTVKNNDNDARAIKYAKQLAAMCDDDCDGCAKCEALYSLIGSSNAGIYVGYNRGSENGSNEVFYTYGQIMKSLVAVLPGFGDVPEEITADRPAPTSTDIIKYSSNCPGCCGYATYCFECSPTPGQRDVRPASEIKRFKDMMNGAGKEIVIHTTSMISKLNIKNEAVELEARAPSNITKVNKNNAKELKTRGSSDTSKSKNNTKTKDAPTLSWTMAGPFTSAAPHLAPVSANTRRAAEAPYACAQSFNGTPIWCVIDSGAASTKISPSFLKTAYPGIKIFEDRATFTGFNGGKSVSTGRIDLKMVWTGKDGRQVLTQGEAWVAPEGQLQETGCHVLLGLPYMRDNSMNITWSTVQRKTKTGSSLPQQLGDKLEIKGITVEIFIAAQ